MKINIAVLDKHLKPIFIKGETIFNPIVLGKEVDQTEAEFSINDIRDKYAGMLNELNPKDNLIFLYKGTFLEKTLDHMKFENDDYLVIIHNKPKEIKKKPIVNLPFLSANNINTLDSATMNAPAALITNLFASILSNTSNLSPDATSNINQILSNINISDFLDNSLELSESAILEDAEELSINEPEDMDEEANMDEDASSGTPPHDDSNDENVSNIVNNTNEVFGNAQGFLNQLNSIFQSEDKYESEIKQLELMGFVNRNKNLEALIVSNGNIEQAVSYILSL